MKVAVYENQMLIGLTPHEHSLLKGADRFDVEVNPKAPAWLKIKPGSRYPRLKSCKDIGHPVWLNLGRPAGLAKFATQEFPITSQMNGHIAVAKAPDYGKAFRPYPDHRRKGGTKEAPSNGLVAVAKAMPLKDAVECVNAHKAEAGKDVVLSIDSRGFLEITMRLGR